MHIYYVPVGFSFSSHAVRKVKPLGVFGASVKCFQISPPSPPRLFQSHAIHENNIYIYPL